MESKNYGRNLKGELITDEMIDKLVREAEEGWDVEELLTWREPDGESESVPRAYGRDSPPEPPRRRR